MKNSTLKQQATETTYLYRLQANYVYTVIISFEQLILFKLLPLIVNASIIDGGNVKLQINLYVSFIFYGRKTET